MKTPLTFGQLVVMARENLDLSQREVARRCVITSSFLCDIEKDRKIPRYGILVRLAAVLKMNVEHLAAQCGAIGQKERDYLRTHPDAAARLRRAARNAK